MEHIKQYGTYKPSARIELATSRLQDGCSTTKLKGPLYKKARFFMSFCFLEYKLTKKISII